MGEIGEPSGAGEAPASGESDMSRRFQGVMATHVSRSLYESFSVRGTIVVKWESCLTERTGSGSLCHFGGTPSP
ncbi:hypothetical protein DVH05_016324 [Phytophthora capsici]|nr:hypothetical protein DVH05_016324 [Phytophthora capsici]